MTKLVVPTDWLEVADLILCLALVQRPMPQFWGTRSWWEVENFYMPCMTETCQYRLLAAEQKQ